MVSDFAAAGAVWRGGDHGRVLLLRPCGAVRAILHGAAGAEYSEGGCVRYTERPVSAAHPLVLRGGKRHLFARRVLLPAPDFHDDDHGVSGAGGERGEERHGRRGGDPGRKRSDGVRRRMAIIVNLDMMLAKRKMTSLELANRVGMTPANLSILKTGKAKAVRMSTMDAICRELQCQPGDLFEFVQDDDPWKR